MSTEKDKLEYWLRGPVPQVPPLLQPVAHALLQARQEVGEALADFPDSLLWERPAQVAAVGFHLQHLTGVLDRLLTYARGESLQPLQLAYLAQEGKPDGTRTTLKILTSAFNQQVNVAINQLIITDETQLLQHRGVGRAQIPSTQLGLLVHAAEHTQRHVGQLLVTARVLKANIAVKN